MEFGILLPYVTPTNRERLLECCRRIDDGPFAYACIGERLTWHNPDNFMALAFAAAVTARVRLLTHVALVPLHPAALFAKRAATLDMMSDGRVTLSVGIGERTDDYRSAEAERHWDRRLDALEEKLAHARRIWAGEPPFPGAGRVGPAPVQPGGPPVYWGGTRFGPKSMRRVVAIDPDGFTSFTPSAHPDDLAAIHSRAAAAWTEAGRTGPVNVLTSFFYALGDDAREQMGRGPGRYLVDASDDSPVGFDSGEVIGNLTILGEDRLRESIDAVEASGFTGLTLIPPHDDPAEVDRLATVIASR